MSHLDGQQHEAERKLLLHALDATNSGNKHSYLDTDVFMLVLD